MSRRRPRTEEEVEAEVQSYGLTNESAAAIVRLGNTLKGVRKLPREPTELLAPGERLRPPSPLSQPVWKQAEIEDSSQPELEAGIRRMSLDDADEEQTEYPLANNAPFLQQDSSVGVNESLRSQEPATSPWSRSRALSPIQEEEEVDEEKKGEGEGEGGGEEEEESETEEEGGQNADSPENNAGC
ncbi:hypothetical protein TGAM01_v204523 [Trichoderma gamsii]|uniref:Uncharacterized protein n=1 Tax=Trichoderma gamsii TaxID=398673 RepID=A0A2P4ZQI0_9HYPO|nr:hypothetical protein TGAM01_v204523 [Trichoderma gamsii]PON26513.1 hypothetical protein TGAM01_v204523 [Trichoderma gamsii]